MIEASIRNASLKTLTFQRKEKHVLGLKIRSIYNGDVWCQLREGEEEPHRVLHIHIGCYNFTLLSTLNKLPDSDTPSISNYQVFFKIE